MQYRNIVEGKFLARPNRFLAKVWIEDKVEDCHVKNTGRCRELLTDHATVYLEFHGASTTRKTNYSLIAVRKGDRLINIDSQAPNKAFHEALRSGVISLPGIETITRIRTETVYQSSRFDFYLEGTTKAYVEVKGVTLEENGIAKFPDAPTERGVKHIMELVEAAREGYLCYMIFVIQMNHINHLIPNDDTHKAFGHALRIARENGVKVLAYECDVDPDRLSLTGTEVPVIL